jgi:glutamate 5-kinase
MKTREEHIDNAKKIVVKVGTSTLTHENGLLNFDRIDKLARQLSDLHNQGKDVVLVTSGAIGVGAAKLGIKSRPETIPEKQAAAAIGQGILLHIYEKFFSEYGQIVAQILLTKDDINNKTRYNNAKNTFDELLNQGVIPIVNENDAIAIHEIKFGDNDTLSALVSSIIDADLLILLSDINGLYDSDPRSNKDAKLISHVDEITKKIESFCGGSGSKLGTGGMYTKIKAAKIAVSNGVSMIIANGADDNIIKDIISNKEVGTLFSAEKQTI